MKALQIIKPDSVDQLIWFNSVKIFLAGSIEMGSAIDWQAEFVKLLESSELLENTIDITIFNPRRNKWDSSWLQEESNPKFNEQVNWEMNNLEKADFIFMYFDPSTKSPISLLELGKYGTSGKMVVCCPSGFWRKGNVDIFCSRESIENFPTLEKAFSSLCTKVRKFVNIV